MAAKTEENWALSEIRNEMIVKIVSKRQREEKSSDESWKRRKDNAAAEKQTGLSGPFLVLPAKEQTENAAPGSEDWAEVYSYEEKRLKSLIDGQGYEKWEKKHQLWEIETGLVPIAEEEDNKPQRVYSYEEKRLKSLVDGKGYGNWEIENRSWEIENRLVPLAEEELCSEEEKRLFDLEAKKQSQRQLLFALSFLEVDKKGKDAFYKRIQQLPIKPLTEEEEKTLQQLLTENTEKAQLTINFQKLATSDAQPCTTLMTSNDKENFVSECRRGYLTPYCKCDIDCKSNIPKEEEEEEYDPEIAPILLAYNRQCRQSHWFDIDDFTQSRVRQVYYTQTPVCPVSPSKHLKKDETEIMMELVNRAIQEYNEKESNVFKYKVLKIEKVNLSLGGMSNTYWMTVKVLNLTLGTPIETFQIHAAVCNVYDDTEIFCCRPREEAIIGLPSCDTCFGLLLEKSVSR